MTQLDEVLCPICLEKVIHHKGLYVEANGTFHWECETKEYLLTEGGELHEIHQQT